MGQRMIGGGWVIPAEFSTALSVVAAGRLNSFLFDIRRMSKWRSISIGYVDRAIRSTVDTPVHFCDRD